MVKTFKSIDFFKYFRKYSGACKDIAKTFNTPFVVLAQINRSVEATSNKRPSMADIKDIGDIEQDMDLGLLLYETSITTQIPMRRALWRLLLGKIAMVVLELVGLNLTLVLASLVIEIDKHFVKLTFH